MFPRLAMPETLPLDPITLQLLAGLLKTAFRLHCMGEDLAGNDPWQLVRAVQDRLGELSGLREVPLSEERLLAFLENGCSDSPAPPIRTRAA